MAILAMDVGQSSTRTRSGATLGPELSGLRGNAGVADQLIDLARAGIAAFPVTTQVCIGATGAEDPDLANRIRDAVGLETRLAHDSVTSHLGALGGRLGVVVAAGTGAVALAVGREVAKVDGWGSLVGDAGSGHWIGRAAVEAVLRAEDGRGGATALTDRVGARFGGLERLGLRLQLDPDHVRAVAAVARDVADLAETDPIAAAITEAAAAELAHTATIAAARVGLTGHDVAAVGKVFANRILLARFEAALTVGTRLITPAGDSLDGATALADLGQHHPLRSAVSIALRL